MKENNMLCVCFLCLKTNNVKICLYIVYRTEQPVYQIFDSEPKPLTVYCILT